MALVFSLTGYLGINFVLALVKSFGALLAVTGPSSLSPFPPFSLPPFIPLFLLSSPLSSPTFPPTTLPSIAFFVFSHLAPLTVPPHPLSTLVTTFRKTITVVLSFLLFTKPFSQQ